MNSPNFHIFFTGSAANFLKRSIELALQEDGEDLTSKAVFNPEHTMQAHIIAKEDSIVAGLPIIPLIFEKAQHYQGGTWNLEPLVEEGARVKKGTVIAKLTGTTSLLLRSERIILNFICHLSGVANLVNEYVKALENTGTKLLDTRKTLPCLRYPEKYAVLVGGGFNHRKNLEEMLMLKDNHIDAAGGIAPAVELLRKAYQNSISIEVECRNFTEVEQAVACKVSRIMLDNMDKKDIETCLAIIPENIEVEISGGVTLDNIRDFVTVTCKRKPDYISVGRLTHSAKVADFSMCTHF